MAEMKYAALFVLIQLVALVLFVIGLPVVGLCIHLRRWPRWAWVWFNDVDGYGPGAPSRSAEFVWLALRNPVNNLRFVPGVSKVGRPLWRMTWGARPGGWYAQAGWNPSGYPVLSAGRNVNPW